jgi:hypothetical protein
MSKTLEDKLLAIYLNYKDKKNPPVPLELIREYLELFGVNLDIDFD